MFFDLEKEMRKIIESKYLPENIIMGVRVDIKDIEINYRKGSFNLWMNLNEFVDALNKRMSKVSLHNLIILCLKKLKEIGELNKW